MDNPDKTLQDYLSQLDPQARFMLADADLGKDVEEFLLTQLGRTLVGLAHQEYAEALFKLESVAWWRRHRIQELQNQAWRARSFLLWLRSLVIQGKASLRMLEEEEPSSD